MSATSKFRDECFQFRGNVSQIGSLVKSLIYNLRVKDYDQSTRIIAQLPAHSQVHSDMAKLGGYNELFKPGCPISIRALFALTTAMCWSDLDPSRWQVPVPALTQSQEVNSIGRMIDNMTNSLDRGLEP